jgi:hypothetical protein
MACLILVFSISSTREQTSKSRRSAFSFPIRVADFIHGTAAVRGAMLDGGLREVSHTTPDGGIKTPDPTEFAFYSNLTAITIESMEAKDRIRFFNPKSSTP